MAAFSRRPMVLGALAAPGLARAQGLATGAALRILVNGTPGSISDILCRTLAEGLKERLGRPVVADNRSGAGGFGTVIGARGQPADGSVIIQANIGVAALAPLVFRRPPIDADAELVPLCHATESPFGLAVKADAPGGGTLRGWLEAMRARQGGEVGVNSATGLPRFAVHLMASVTGIPLQPVIYRSGGAILPDLEAGHVPAGMTIASEFIEQHRGGRLRMLAQSQAEGRWRHAPEVPRFNEQGVDFVGSAWNAFFAPAGTPAPVAMRLAEAITASLHAPDAAARLQNLGLEPTGGTPEQLRARIAADRARWRPVITASGFQADEP